MKKALPRQKPLKEGRSQHLKRFSLPLPGAAIPLFAGDFLSLGLPPPRDEAQVVQAIVHGHRVQMHHLKARSNPSPVPLPAGHNKAILKVSAEQEQLKNTASQQFQRQCELGPAGTGLPTDSVATSDRATPWRKCLFPAGDFNYKLVESEDTQSTEQF